MRWQRYRDIRSTGEPATAHMQLRGLPGAANPLTVVGAIGRPVAIPGRQAQRGRNGGLVVGWQPTNRWSQRCRSYVRDAHPEDHRGGTIDRTLRRPAPARRARRRRHDAYVFRPRITSAGKSASTSRVVRRHDGHGTSTTSSTWEWMRRSLRPCRPPNWSPSSGTSAGPAGREQGWGPDGRNGPASESPKPSKRRRGRVMAWTKVSGGHRPHRGDRGCRRAPGEKSHVLVDRSRMRSGRLPRGCCARPIRA